jgi:uncharacterized repeat protein (TIGR03943 family)
VSLDVRTARVLALGSWSLCLLWLWVSGEVARYLGPRTWWVVPFGGIGLALVTVAYARLTHDAHEERRPLSLRQALGLAALVVPALIAFTMAGSALGSLAASRKLSSRGVDLTRLAAHLNPNAAQASFLELDVAARDPDFAARTGIADGSPVTLTGFVMRPGRAAGAPFQLARFYILCCVADAVALKQSVYPPSATPAFGKDTWLRVRGHVVRRDGTFAVRADRVTPVGRPSDPYRYFLR